MGWHVVLTADPDNQQKKSAEERRIIFMIHSHTNAVFNVADSIQKQACVN